MLNANKFLLQALIGWMTVLLSLFISPEIRADEKTVVIYIPGWQHSQRKNFDTEITLLKEIFAAGSVEVFAWEKEVELNFPECSRNTDREIVPQLTEKIMKLSDKQRSRIILVGHSLGGRIAIKTMAELAARDKKIRCGIFLGSAISYDDSDIGKALEAALQECINVFSVKDKILKKLYGIYNYESALGAYGYKCRCKKLKQFKGDFSEHSAYSYFSFLQKIQSKRIPEYIPPKKIRVPYERNSGKLPPSNKYKVEDQKQNWKLIACGDTLYIVDPYDKICTYGNRKKMQDAFNSIKRQLDE